MSSDIYDRLIDELHNVERQWKPPSRSGPQTTTSGGNGLASGIISVMGGSGLYTGIQRAMSELDSLNRLRNVLNAIDDSFPAAFNEITKKLRGISIDAIKPILRDMLTDVALYLGGSTALGAGVGGGIGAFAGGVGAIPGAMVGGWLGFELGNVIMALTGLKSVVVFMKDAVPAAIKCYGLGFNKAWGEDPTDPAPWRHSAWHNFAEGHIWFLMALLMGIVGYLTRGKGDFGALLTEIRASKKLGPKMAQWIEANKDNLLKNPELQQGVKASAGGAKDAADDAASNIPKPTRGGSPKSEPPERIGNPLFDNPSAVVKQRVAELQSQIPANSQGRITMAAAVAEDSNGARSVLIGTSEPRGYLRPGVTVNPGETVVSGTGHAEADIVDYANANNLSIVDIGATRPVCGGCQDAIAPTGANISTPLKQ